MKILLVDDDLGIRESLPQKFKLKKWEVSTAKDEDIAIEILKDKEGYFDVIILDMKMHNDKSGIEVLEFVKQQDVTTQIIILTAYGTIPNAGEVMEYPNSFGYQVKGIDKWIEQLLAKIEKACKRKKDKDNKREQEEERGRKLYELICSILERIDNFTKGHSRRVAINCIAILRELKKSTSTNKREEKDKWTVGMFHDVGKIIVSKEILQKIDPLTVDEIEKIRKHPEVGASIVEGVYHLEKFSDCVKYHHERFDGKTKGVDRPAYPGIKSGKDIPECSRIIAVADAFDAMTSDRAYRYGIHPDDAIKILLSEKGKQFDPDVVDAFIKAYYSRPRQIDMSDEAKEKLSEG
ncbi:MAG: response regulator [Candidatus Eremiobacteraeota bacterium]|nr:response regulator [Candidatus Eremiobacteraeota bacterium]